MDSLGINPKILNWRKMFANMPTEINRLIGSFLDIESRIQFYKVLPENDDKFVKKLDAIKHHKKMKLAEIKLALDKITHARGDPNKQGILLIRLFNTFRKSKDTWYHGCDAFIKVVYDKVCEFSNKENPDLANIPNKRIRNGLHRCAIMCKAKFYMTFTWEQLGITVE